MLLRTEKLANGMNFNFIRSDKFKSSVMILSAIMPLTPESAIHVRLLSTLIGRGTKKYPSISLINRRLDELYGSYVEVRSAKIGNNIIFTVSAEILDGKYILDGTDTLSGVLEVIAELLFSPCFADEGFDENIVSQEKKILLDDIKAQKNNTRSYAVMRCMELIREGISNAPNYEERIRIAEAVSTNDIRSYYKRLAASPLDVFYIGSEDPESVAKKVCYAFEAHTPKYNREILPLKPYGRTKYTAKTESMAVAQGKLSMGFSTGLCMCADKGDHYAALMLNEIFGGSPSSKLFLNVRERMSLCYYCSSSFSTDSGVITVSSGIKVSDLDKVRNAILAQLEDIKKGNISEQEITAAKRSIANSYRQIYDNPFDIHAFYSGRAIFGISESIDDCINGFMAVTAEDIIAFAQRVKLDAEFFVKGTLSDKEDCDDD